MGAIDTAQSKAQWGGRAIFFRNRYFTAVAAGGILSRYAALLLQADSGLPQGASFHGGHKIQHTAASATGKAVKHILAQVHVKGVPPLGRDGSDRSRDTDRGRCGAMALDTGAALRAARRSV
jgi:hypothetical protein